LDTEQEARVKTKESQDRSGNMKQGTWNKTYPRENKTQWLRAVSKFTVTSSCHPELAEGSREESKTKSRDLNDANGTEHGT